MTDTSKPPEPELATLHDFFDSSDIAIRRALWCTLKEHPERRTVIGALMRTGRKLSYNGDPAANPPKQEPT